jgi:uncharacterized protein (TIGR00369 family)
MDEVDRDFLQKTFAKCRFHQHLSFELEVVEKGRVNVLVRYKPELDQGMGFLHGGVYASALDTATYYAALSHYGRSDKLPLTQEYKINLLASARAEDIRVEATLLKAGRTVAVAEARIYGASGKLLAAGMASFMIRAG